MICFGCHCIHFIHALISACISITCDIICSTSSFSSSVRAVNLRIFFFLSGTSGIYILFKLLNVSLSCLVVTFSCLIFCSFFVIFRMLFWITFLLFCYFLFHCFYLFWGINIFVYEFLIFCFPLLCYLSLNFCPIRAVYV